MIPAMPWWVRWGVDFSLFAVPYWLICNYPTMMFVPAQEWRRQRRRRDFSEVQLRENPAVSIEEVVALKQQLGLRE